MSCEQAIYAEYIPTYKPFDVSEQPSLAHCSQKCCNTNEEGRSCGIYSFWGSTGRCHLYQFPDQPFYLPLPSVRDMIKINENVNTGILMKRKIVTWIPWLIMIIIVLLIFVDLVIWKKRDHTHTEFVGW